tara:strand:+ start:3648 stop:3866 length:219 start_codon:yes stop_codon:yes gene_type:complete
MIEFLVMYCKEKNYDIVGEKILKEGQQIGNIDHLDKIVTLGSNKYKFGDFALAILEGYFDLYDGGEYVNVQS